MRDLRRRAPKAPSAPWGSSSRCMLDGREAEGARPRRSCTDRACVASCAGHASAAAGGSAMVLRSRSIESVVATAREKARRRARRSSCCGTLRALYRTSTCARGVRRAARICGESAASGPCREWSVLKGTTTAVRRVSCAPSAGDRSPARSSSHQSGAPISSACWHRRRECTCCAAGCPRGSPSGYTMREPCRSKYSGSMYSLVIRSAERRSRDQSSPRSMARRRAM
mmetsp:Transcript_4033/g.13535  ORF Transcript_4033/g.13535 Transcript_4033/m.13535 type:complete len:227 (-) Transcript_4033:357-1037(-)